MNTATAAASETATDSVERSIVIQAPRQRVWQALSNAEEFGRWFGADLQGQTFTPGQLVRGPFTIEGATHLTFDVIIERMEPEKTMTWRWHPHASDSAADYSKEERTLVTFTLKDAPGGATLLQVVETGFDKVPPGRRLDAFRGVSKGWPWQLERIRAHVTTH